MTAPNIVVGIDGSPSSLTALAWARDEARLRDVALHVVLTFEPLRYTDEQGYPVPAEEGQAIARATAQRTLDEAVADIDDVKLERHAVAAVDAARVLVDRSEDADLLVVGSRGYGGFAGMMLGSVSQKCVNHAGCPVVVVRPRPAQREAAEA